ncbi:unnamed protein product [Eruca vesicaria subsp. sativa]|uniref:Uncharacterized protein n=1 Tax=Eruca vesicaria subsp. sativa TaxID=29727 RepID=A0ABC8LRX3_ERUVS|nr:unnamed protein product [Eruca vesicaria subsp. sativa]
MMTWLFSLSRFLVSRGLSCFVVKVLGLVVFALVAKKCRKLRVLDLIESEVADDEVDWISCFPEGETTHLESLCFDCVESPINFKALEGIVLRSPFLKKLRTNRFVSLEELHRLIMLRTPQLTSLGTGSFSSGTHVEHEPEPDYASAFRACTSLACLSGFRDSSFGLCLYFSLYSDFNSSGSA